MDTAQDTKPQVIDMANDVSKFNSEQECSEEDELLLYHCLFHPEIDFRENIITALTILSNADPLTSLEPEQQLFLETVASLDIVSRMTYIHALSSLDIYQLREFCNALSIQ